MPSSIGGTAERVLLGCIEASVSARWTVAMVDEVAWGVGWGNDDAEPAPTPTRVSSRRRHTPSPPPALRITQHDTTRPSLEAARRRSSSRMTRSRSRAPALAGRSLSTSGSSTREPRTPDALGEEEEGERGRRPAFGSRTLLLRKEDEEVEGGGERGRPGRTLLLRKKSMGVTNEFTS